MSDAAPDHQPQDSSEAPSAGRSKLGSVLYVSGLLAVAALCVNWLLVWKSRIDFDSQVEELREQGIPTAYAELYPDAIPDEQNAVALLNGVKTQTTSVSKFLDAYFESEEFDRFDAGEGQLETLQAAFLNHQATIDVYRQAISAEGYVPPENTTLIVADALDRTSMNRDIMRILQSRYAMFVNAGKTSEAREAATDLLGFALLAEKEPMIIGVLAAQTTRRASLDAVDHLLQTQEFNADQRKALDRRLAGFGDSAALIRGLESERVLGINSLREGVFQESGTLAQVLGWSSHQPIEPYLETMSTFVDFSRKPFHEIAATLRKSVKDSRSNPVRHALTKLYLGTRLALEREIAKTRCVRVLNSILGRFTGDPPDRIELNTLSLPPEVTIDPFNGERLRYRLTKAGPVVYSVGSNGRDDQADPNRKPDADIVAGEPFRNR